MNKKGFTLVELIVVIAIMAILAAVLVPTISSQLDKSKDTRTLQEVSEIGQVVSLQWADARTTKAQILEDTAGKFGDYVSKMSYYTSDTVFTDATLADDNDQVIMIKITDLEIRTSKIADSDVMNNHATQKTPGTYECFINISTGYIYYDKKA